MNLPTEADLRFDRDHLWHPYTSLSDPLPTYPVVSAHGCRLRLADGRTLIDGMSSWWCAVHGYNVPELNRALREQAEQMAHVMFGGITHPKAIELGRKLVAITPAGLDRVFLADSGSVSVEVAMKMAVQYHYRRGERRTRFLTFRGGYHGDTTGPMSVCDPATGMHSIFTGFLPQHEFIRKPPAGFDAAVDERYLAELDAFIAEHATEAAAFICEPVVQGAGGMHFYNPAYLDHLRRLCDRHGLLLIFDEIATGFGRTGKLFATEHTEIVPDILCLGKALTGGYMTLAATLCTERVGRTVGTLMHGPTFMGNPLACAVACASIDLLLASGWAANVGRIARRFASVGERPMPGVRDIRSLGAILVFELDAAVDVARIQREFVERGVWVRPFGRLVYLMPPFVISEGELEALIEVTREVI